MPEHRLVCECGEAFDDIDIAKGHECDYDDGHAPRVFQIMTEDEAM